MHRLTRHIFKLFTLRVSPPAHPGTTPRRIELSGKCGSNSWDSRAARRRDEEEEAGWVDGRVFGRGEGRR
eukprot:7861783-Pyramimonas_sp.AAC.1